MAFKRNDIKRIANAFDCSQKDVQSAIYVGIKYLKNNTINTYTVARHMSIIVDKLQKANHKESITYPDFGMKHNAIRKHRAEIIELYYSNVMVPNRGWGWIASEIKRMHNVKVSRQTVRLYILKYQEWKECQI